MSWCIVWSTETKVIISGEKLQLFSVVRIFFFCLLNWIE